MLAQKDITTTIAVKDLGPAGKFYGETLGLSKVESPDSAGIMFQSGNSKVFVYQSSFAGTNQATAMTWVVGKNDIEPLISSLKSKGVSFEHYDMPGLTRQGDIHVAASGEMMAAWFKDPDGNILSLVTG